MISTTSFVTFSVIAAAALATDTTAATINIASKAPNIGAAEEENREKHTIAEKTLPMLSEMLRHSGRTKIAELFAAPNPASNTHRRMATCDDTCKHANDGECGDGGPGADTHSCGFGKDCGDCGTRAGCGTGACIKDGERSMVVSDLPATGKFSWLTNFEGTYVYAGRYSGKRYYTMACGQMKAFLFYKESVNGVGVWRIGSDLNSYYIHSSISVEDVAKATHAIRPSEYDGAWTLEIIHLTQVVDSSVYIKECWGSSNNSAPATDAPATEAPATDAPATDAPVTDAPEAPATDTEASATDAPATDVSEASAKDAPAADAPATDAPATGAHGSDSSDGSDNDKGSDKGSSTTTIVIIVICAIVTVAGVLYGVRSRSAKPPGQHSTNITMAVEMEENPLATAVPVASRISQVKIAEV